jgi:hypothetical protein
MARTKAAAKKKSSRAAAQPKAVRDVKQLVITLGASHGEIAKIEHLGSAGKRRLVSGAELAKLAGDDMEDFREALEAAYAAGLQDGFEEALKDEPFAESGPHRQSTEDSAGEFRSGVRRTIVRHALRRSLVRGAAAGHNGAQEGR